MNENENRIIRQQVWYRLSRYIQGEYYGEHEIKLVRRYFIDIYPYTLHGFLWALEREKNKSKSVESRIRQVKFHIRWFEPIIKYPFLIWIPFIKKHLNRIRHKTHRQTHET